MPGHKENRSECGLKANRVEDKDDFPQHKQGGIRGRTVLHRQDTQHHPDGPADRPGEGISGDDHQVN